MIDKEQLIREIEQAPDALVTAVLDFYLFLKQRQRAAPAPQAPSPDAQSSGILALLHQVEVIQAQVPPEEWDKLPHDGAINHDHYLYGAPKAEE